MPEVSTADAIERIERGGLGTAVSSPLERSWNSDCLREGTEVEVCQWRVLIVDGVRDAADDLGRIVSEVGGLVMVAYGYTRAVEIAEMFQPHLVLVDVGLAEFDGRSIAVAVRERQSGRSTKIVALSEHSSSRPSEAIIVGIDLILTRPVSPATIFEMLMSLPDSQDEECETLPARDDDHYELHAFCDCESAFCEGVLKFQQDIFGTSERDVRTKLASDILILRMHGRNLHRVTIDSSSPANKGALATRSPCRPSRDVTYSILEVLVHSIFGVRIRFVDHDICESTGDEIVVIGLSEAPSAKLRSNTASSRGSMFHRELCNLSDGFGCGEGSGTRLSTESSTGAPTLQIKVLSKFEDEHQAIHGTS